MEPHELIVCRDVSLGYEGQTVLSHLNLTIRDGDYLCIVGDNGSGKSTLLRGLLGLLAPQSGEILRAPELERGAVGYLPQQTRAQRDFPATVLEVVLSGCLNRKGLLGQVADGAMLQRLRVLNNAGLRLKQPQKPPHQGGLAGAVVAHHAEIVSLGNSEIQAGEDGSALISQRHIPADDQFVIFHGVPPDTARRFPSARCGGDQY